MKVSFAIMEYGIPSIVSIFLLFGVLSFPLNQVQYAFSQSLNNSTAGKINGSNATQAVDLIDIHTSPSNLKVPSKFQVFSTVVNKSPSSITFTAGVCDSPLSAKFIKNVVIKYTQGCTTSSPPFELKSGDRVTISGPSSGTIYQAIAPGQTSASATLHYQTGDGQAATVTKPFVFTINP